ncbi:TetR/AcrR family transcriptional regulator [Sporomusa sp. KB1]|uniref:TetR/AcrR family transcriptional regulator n=1 Tax=Sporomusa sp. KB1 TaxID=943346 RepID=UPI001C953F47|nr:TetR/AcrR family transcriptional regulator [Sporomusa sp. KB1]
MHYDPSNGGRLVRPNIKGEKTKEHLVECAAHLFLQNGYNATGINDILSKAGVSKGSFYFYFASKKELAMEVADYYSRIKISEISKTAEGRTWEDFIEKLIGDMIKRAKQKKSFGCPLAVLGMEIAFLEPDIADRYYESIKKVVGIFADVFRRSGISEEKAVLIADHALAIYEGYLLFYRISKNIDELEKLRRDLKAIEGSLSL